MATNIKMLPWQPCTVGVALVLPYMVMMHATALQMFVVYVQNTSHATVTKKNPEVDLIHDGSPQLQFDTLVHLSAIALG